MDQFLVFDSSPLHKEMVLMEQYIDILKDEKKSCQEFAVSSMNSDHDRNPEEVFNFSMQRSAAKRRLLEIDQEIESKENFVKTLREKILRDSSIIESTYQDYIKNRASFLDNLTKVFNIGVFITPHHKNQLTYLKTELHQYEATLKAINHLPLTQKIGIMEGIVFYYTRILHAINQNRQ
jgi:hypothetical protein